jgi:hypothetical protein
MIEIYAPCGINCTVCDCYVATQNDDREARQKMAEQYKTSYSKDIDPETIVCDGCPGEGRHIGFCAECGIRACAYERGFATCAECAELPCEKGQFIWTSNSKSLENLNTLKTR